MAEYKSDPIIEVNKSLCIRYGTLETQTDYQLNSRPKGFERFKIFIIELRKRIGESKPTENKDHCAIFTSAESLSDGINKGGWKESNHASMGHFGFCASCAHFVDLSISADRKVPLNETVK